MHKIKNTPKIVTIIGLIIEGLGIVVLVLSAIMLSISNKLPMMTSFITELTADELEMYEIMIGVMVIVHIVLAIVVAIMFTINLVLFTKLIKGDLKENQAKKVYLYQAIWGGINIVINPITGILYLISGIQGYGEQPNT